METTDAPMTEEQEINLLMEPIEPEAEDETGGETQEDETIPVEDEADDDASETEGEEVGEDDSDDDDSDETEEDDEAEDDDSEGEPLFTVKVNGEERQITEQELKNDFSGRAALQERHETLKAQESQIQEFAQTLHQERQRLLQLYEQAQTTGFKPAPQPPDMAMRDRDFVGYYEAKDDYERELAEYQQTQQQFRYQQQQAQAQAERQMQETLAQQREILLEALPELKDPEKGKAVQKAWIDTAKAYGFTGDDLNNVTDARTFKMLDDARKWRELQAGKQAAKKPREEAKVVTRPKGKMRDGGKQAMAKKQLQAIKSGNEDAIVDWLLNP